MFCSAHPLAFSSKDKQDSHSHGSARLPRPNPGLVTEDSQGHSLSWVSSDASSELLPRTKHAEQTLCLCPGKDNSSHAKSLNIMGCVVTRRHTLLSFLWLLKSPKTVIKITTVSWWNCKCKLNEGTIGRKLTWGTHLSKNTNPYL